MTMTEFARQVDQLKTQLYRTAYGYVGDEATALEMVNEAVYRGLKSLSGLRQPEYFTTWLTRILINQCLQELRRRRRIEPVATIPESAAEEYDKLPLKEAIRRLPEDLRAIINLRFLADYSLAQTAECLNIPQGTVVTRQRRALQLLKLDLSEEAKA